MSWNESLYLYQRARGGTFLGPSDDEWFAELILEYKGAPLIVRSELLGQERTSTPSVRAFTIVQMERIYELKISSKHVLNQGVNLVLRREDYGCPEVSRTRRIRTNETNFTKLVMRDAALRRSLELWPKYAASVAPTFRGTEGGHMVDALAPSFMVGDPLTDWADDRIFSNSVEPQVRQTYVDDKEYDLEDFTTRLDGLLDLVRHTRDAVAAWPMGVKQREK